MISAPSLAVVSPQADEVAQALAHLAARAVDREAVGQQAAVGRVALERAGDQQRRVEPAAVLVVALEVEVGLGLGAVVVGHGRARMAAAQHVEEGRAGVEPDVEDVVALRVVLAVGAEHVLGGEPRPGLDAALLDDVGGAVDQRQRVGMQLAGRLVQEERQRHAPVALPADAPVGPVGDHVVQPGPAVLRIERGRVDRVERGLAQGLVLPDRPRRRRRSRRRARPCARTTAPRRGRSPASCGASSADSCAPAVVLSNRRPASRSASTICGFAFQMCSPPKSGRLCS